MLYPALLLICYATVGGVLWTRAMRYRLDHRRPRAFDIFRPGLFRPDGQPARRLAARFYVAAGVAALVAYALFRVREMGAGD